jgi:hypothetical protein
MKALMTLLAVIAVAATASAGGTIATTLLQVGVGIDGACYVRNVGSKAESITVEVDDTEDRLGPTFDSCDGAPLGAGTTCVVLFRRGPFRHVGCSATTRSGSAKNLRGTLEIRDTSGGFHTSGAVDLQ